MKSGFLKELKIKEILKFCVGGGSAVVVDFLAYLILKSFISVSVAKAMSFVLGASVGFIINKLWTFESKKFKLTEVLKYILLYVCSAVANTLVNKGVLALSGVTLFAFLCATAVSTIMNFLGQKFFVFSKNHQEEDKDD